MRKDLAKTRRERENGREMRQGPAPLRRLLADEAVDIMVSMKGASFHGSHLRKSVSGPDAPPCRAAPRRDVDRRYCPGVRSSAGSGQRGGRLAFRAALRGR